MLADVVEKGLGVMVVVALHLVGHEEDGLERALNALVLNGNVVQTLLVVGHLGLHHPGPLGELGRCMRWIQKSKGLGWPHTEWMWWLLPPQDFVFWEIASAVGL